MKISRKYIPEFDGDYVPIYRPKGDIYRGIDTESFRHGTYYEEWIPNDFSVLRDGEDWHIVGITHPRPKGFLNDVEWEGDVHEAEFQLFHATAHGRDFAQHMREGSFSDREKILYPSERPGDGNELWAPHLMKWDGRFQVIYSPKKIRRVSSADFKDWQTEPMLFECEDLWARDPFVYEEDGVLSCLYTSNGAICYRTSTDMLHWSEEKILQRRLLHVAECESPFLMKRHGIYYLFWSICDGRMGTYDWRTLVFAGDSFEKLDLHAPVTMLKGHAVEVVRDESGNDYLLSVFYPNNGISAVKLKWIPVGAP